MNALAPTRPVPAADRPAPQPARTAISLADLLAGLAWPPANLAALVPAGLCLDSRAVQPGDVFVAVSGGRMHGLEFAGQALARGAGCVLYQPPAPASLQSELANWPAIAVPNLRQHLGTLADRAWQSPSRQLQCIGVTGTNGKTSTVHLLAQALAGAGIDVASIGTLGSGRPGALAPASHTTPDVLSVHASLRGFLDAGISHVAMEVSSHALDQGRVDQVAFGTAVFTNLSRDHLDYHGDMAAYAAAKARLFNWPGLANAVINSDDACGRELLAAIPASVRVLRYGVRPQPDGWPEFSAHGIVTAADGLRFSLVTPNGQIDIHSRLLGRFNIANLLAVAACLHADDWSLAEIGQALARLDSVPGRMNRLGGGEQPLVVVDYAHTPDALAQALASLREHTVGRLHCLFGCGGERDTGKRAQMAAAAQAHADAIVVTDDNPRHEDGDAIVADILLGFAADARARVRVQRDRARAIALVVAEAGPGDIVLIAGKGHEPWQEIAGQRRPFDDSRHALAALEAGSC
ncbi:MAG: UDP-N-acetylmuramoyl-L-alanyl-D-glutamate--2,6-diaminopimelate ligase [Xanthomonadales bacterium]|nr:UDP-N-acetylmuramoyl-L-alanyl-D-glutamate--2,6-diaminopimelate ligase [Xanthomonadales bacterium]